MCVWMCVCAHLSVGVCKWEGVPVKPQLVDTLELVLQAIVRYLPWVMGTNLGPMHE